jgi:hypothetical protein
MSSIQDPKLLAAGCAAINDWAFEYQRFDPRYVCTATIPLLDAEHAVAEIHRVAGIGFAAAYFSVTPGLGAPRLALHRRLGAGVVRHRGDRPRHRVPHRHRGPTTPRRCTARTSAGRAGR